MSAEPISNYHETERAVQKRDAASRASAAELPADKFGSDFLATRQRYEKERLYQIGDARLPATAREDRALARWVEIDERRYVARAVGRPFHFTPAERALKTRLLKAGLIINKKQWRLPSRQQQAMQEKAFVDLAKVHAARGDPDAIRYLHNYKRNKANERWLKRERMLRRLPAETLIGAAKDVMVEKGIQRTLASVWRDFIEAFDAASPEKRAAFRVTLPAAFDHALKSRQ